MPLKLSQCPFSHGDAGAMYWICEPAFDPFAQSLRDHLRAIVAADVLRDAMQAHGLRQRLPPPACVAQGLQVSRGDVRQHMLLQTKVGDEPAQTNVLALQVLHLPGLTDLKTAVLLAPAVVTLLGDLRLTALVSCTGDDATPSPVPAVAPGSTDIRGDGADCVPPGGLPALEDRLARMGRVIEGLRKRRRPPEWGPSGRCGGEGGMAGLGNPGTWAAGAASVVVVGPWGISSQSSNEATAANRTTDQHKRYGRNARNFKILIL